MDGNNKSFRSIFFQYNISRKHDFFDKVFLKKKSI